MDKAQKSKRVFLMSWDNTRPAFIKAAQELQKRGYEIIYWTVPSFENLTELKKEFADTIFHLHDDAIKVKPAADINMSDLTPPGEDLIKHFYELESTLLTMKKFYILSESELKKKHLFHDLIRYWHGVIIKYKPDIIYFSNIAHSVYDYTVFTIAKSLNIKTVIFAYTNIADRYLTLEDFREGCLKLRQEYSGNKSKQIKFQDLSFDIKKFYEWHKNNLIGEVQPDLKDTLKGFGGFSKWRLKFTLFFKSFYDLSILKKSAGYFKKTFGPNMQKEYISLQGVPDFNEKYIYVALAYQPECSTSPLGGVFVDQILLINILSFSLPEGWKIYVKEHPMQWATSSLAYFNFRYKGYYEEIAKIKNVRLMPVETNSHKLINESQAVSTVSGTSGVEALLRLKPVLLFGNIWYQDCSGVFKVKNSSSCREAIKEITVGYKVNEQDIVNYFYSLDRVSYHFNYEMPAAKNSKLTEEEAGKIIIDSMIGVAERVN